MSVMKAFNNLEGETFKFTSEEVPCNFFHRERYDSLPSD